MSSSARSLRLTLCLALAAAAVPLACSSDSAARRPDALAVTRVVLYQNGIGYFERAGVAEGRRLQLQVRPDQIDDLLTSLTVIDKRGGHVSSVSLPVDKSSSMVLGELPPQVRDAGGLLAVLDAFRGARVDIDFDGGSAEGRVVGVERSLGAEGREEWRVTVLTDDAELVPIRLDRIERVQLGDRTLTVGLDRALDVALGDGDWKPVEVDVHFPDDGSHDIVMSYIVAMPTWKPAYRLIFGEEGQARLQGWAVVDNVSGEDWTDVDLSLTAGAPISFIVDLHTPRLPSRPDLTGQTWSSYAEAPPEVLDSFNEPSPQPAPRPKPSSRSAAAPRAEEAKKDYAFDDDASGELYGEGQGGMGYGEVTGSLADSATGQRVGALFRYDIPVPVTVPDGSSALVTIVNEDVEGEDVLLYDPSSGSANALTHPYRSVRLENTTPFVIERGPLTIYKNSTFVGEGITAQIPSGQTVFVPYALESGIHVERSYRSGGTGEQQLVKIANGVVTIESFQTQETTFKVTNKTGDDSTLYVRIDKLPGHELRAPTDAIAQGDVWFVPIALDQVDDGAAVEQTVIQASRARQQLTLLDPRLETVLELYVSDTSVDPTVRGQLEGVLVLRRELGDLEHRVGTLEERQTQLRDRASDLRRNIQVLGDAAANRKLRDELVGKLGKVEDELSDIDRQLVAAGEQRYGLEVQIREALEGITWERPEATP